MNTIEFIQLKRMNVVKIWLAVNQAICMIMNKIDLLMINILFNITGYLKQKFKLSQ